MVVSGALFDTHCHVHEAVRRTTPVYDKWHAKGPVDPATILRDARDAGVQQMICVGTTLDDSQLAIEFVQTDPQLYASIGIHPHEAGKASSTVQAQFAALVHQPKVVAVGECGLDYFYNHSPREAQLAVMKFQINLALEADLPLIFHVREAFDDFWPVFDSFGGKIRGVVHSFTDTPANLQKAIDRGLYIGVNGIATFARENVTYITIPQHLLLLETDAPFLTPEPYRGKMCEPKHLRVTAEYVSKLRGETLEDLAAATTRNAQKLFGV